MDDLAYDEAVEGHLEAAEVRDHHSVPSRLVGLLHLALVGDNPLSENEEAGEDDADEDRVRGHTSIVDLLVQFWQDDNGDGDVANEHGSDNGDGLELEKVAG